MASTASRSSRARLSASPATTALAPRSPRPRRARPASSSPVAATSTATTSTALGGDHLVLPELGDHLDRRRDDRGRYASTMGTRPPSRPTPSAARSSRHPRVTRNPGWETSRGSLIRPIVSSRTPRTTPGGPARTIRGCPPPRRPAPPASSASRTSFRRTTRRPTSRGSWPRRSRRCRRWPTPSRSSRSTTARATARRRSPMPSRPRTPTSFGSSTTRRTSATAPHSGRASRPSRYDLVAFTDGDRQFKVADLGRLTARLAEPDHARCRRRLPHQAGRSAHPHPLRARLPLGQPDLLRPQGHRRRLRLQALPPRGARGPAGRIGWRLLLGRDAHQAAGGRPDRRRGRRPALPADSRIRDRRQTRRSSCAPCATSGCSDCGCG